MGTFELLGLQCDQCGVCMLDDAKGKRKGLPLLFHSHQELLREGTKRGWQQHAQSIGGTLCPECKDEQLQSILDSQDD